MGDGAAAAGRGPGREQGAAHEHGGARTRSAAAWAYWASISQLKAFWRRRHRSAAAASAGQVPSARHNCERPSARALAARRRAASAPRRRAGDYAVGAPSTHDRSGSRTPAAPRGRERADAGVGARRARNRRDVELQLSDQLVARCDRTSVRSRRPERAARQACLERARHRRDRRGARRRKGGQRSRACRGGRFQAPAMRRSRQGVAGSVLARARLRGKRGCCRCRSALDWQGC